jgi:hypothetical protein
METNTKSPYEIKMQNWTIEQHIDCPTFIRVKEWSIENGYSLYSDVSYNGFLTIRKNICESEDPHDGNRLELQIFCDESISTKEKYHGFQQYDMEIDFENHSMLSPLKYRYKMVHGENSSKGTKDLEELLAFTLKRESELKSEFEQFLKEHPTTEWKMTDPDNFQYGRLVRGTPEFKEFDRVKLPDLFDKMKRATQERVDAYLTEHFKDEYLWIQSKVLLFRYSDEEKESYTSPYYKSLSELKEIYGSDWEFILAECIFEQENGLY